MRISVNELKSVIAEAMTKAYEILGVAPGASESDIRKAYREKSLALHPEMNPEQDTAQARSDVDVAFDLLVDPARRSEYEKFGSESLGDYNGQRPAPAAQVTPPTDRAAATKAAAPPGASRNNHRIYGSKNKPPVTRLKGALYRGAPDSQFRAGDAASVVATADGKLSVKNLSNNHSQIWDAVTESLVVENAITAASELGVKPGAPAGEVQAAFKKKLAALSTAGLSKMDLALSKSRLKVAMNTLLNPTASRRMDVLAPHRPNTSVPKDPSSSPRVPLQGVEPEPTGGIWDLEPTTSKSHRDWDIWDLEVTPPGEEHSPAQGPHGTAKMGPQGTARMAPQSPPPARPEPRAAEPVVRGKKSTYKIYGGKNKPPVTRVKAKIYTGAADSRFKPGQLANVAIKDDGNLDVINPDTGHTQSWTPVGEGLDVLWKDFVNEIKETSKKNNKNVAETVLLPHDDLKQMISSMPADDVAVDDYVDEETGEVYLAKGKPARSSTMHDQHLIDRASKKSQADAASDAENERWDQEDAEYDEYKLGVSNQVQREFESAVKEYADGFANYGSEYSMGDFERDDFLQGAAPDAAEGFFASYDWRKWAQWLGMSRDEMKTFVTDEIFEKMLSR